MNAEQIAKVIGENRLKYDYFGLRVMSRNPITCKYPTASVGQILDNSYDWCDGDTTESEINGTCAIEINVWDGDLIGAVDAALAKTKIYDGKQTVLIAGRSSEYGADEGEIIIRNARVIAIAK